MKLSELVAQLNRLADTGWANCEVYATSNTGSSFNEPVVGTSAVDPPVPKPAPFVCLLVDD